MGETTRRPTHFTRDMIVLVGWLGGRPYNHVPEMGEMVGTDAILIPLWLSLRYS